MNVEVTDAYFFRLGNRQQKVCYRMPCAGILAIHFSKAFKYGPSAEHEILVRPGNPAQHVVQHIPSRSGQGHR